MLSVKNIADGVRFLNIRTDRFKTGSIKITAALPIEGANLSANALMAYLLKHSCKKYPDFTKLNGRLDELYGAALGGGVAKSGDAQILSLSINFLDDRLTLDGKSISDECAKMLADLLFDPLIIDGGFDITAFEDEKRLLKQTIEEEFNDKRTYARMKCEEIICANEPYGKNPCGSLEELESVTGEDVLEAWKSLISSAEFFITCVGSSTGKKIENIFTKAFNAVERQPVKVETVCNPKGGRFRRVNEEFKVNQGKLVLGFRTGTTSKEDNYPAEIIMTDLFGGNTYSKLFLNVREKLSLCYYCWVRFIPRKGIALVDCGIDSDKEKQASAEILAQLNDVRSGKFTDEDIAASKMGMRERWMSSVDSPNGICSWYSAQILDENIKTPEEAVAQLESVTREDICAAAKKMALEAVYMLSAQEEAENED